MLVCKTSYKRFANGDGPSRATQLWNHRIVEYLKLGGITESNSWLHTAPTEIKPYV